MKQPTVFLLESDTASRASITHVLHHEQIAVHSFSEPQVFLNNFDSESVNCLVLALQVSGVDGIAVAEHLAADGYCPPYIVMSCQPGIGDVTRAMKCGALDFMQKPLNGHQLVTRVRQAFHEDERRRNVRNIRSNISKRIQSLSAREREVLALVMAGNLNKQIAKQLRISVKTVEAHRSNIVRKMHVASFIQVAHMVAFEQTFRDRGISLRGGEPRQGRDLPLLT